MRGVDMVFMSSRRSVVGVAEMSNSTTVWVEGMVQVRRGCS
jgi:hypothetical protein